MPKKNARKTTWGGARDGAGRPALAPDQRKEKPPRARVTFDLSPDEAALVDAKAEERGVSRSAYIRGLVLADIGLAQDAKIKGRRPRRFTDPQVE